MIYATSAILRPENAQALQILAMSRAFAEVLNGRFTLVSPKVDTVIESEFNWRQIPCAFRKRSLRYLELGTRIRRIHLDLKDDVVFTRDIGLARLFHQVGAHVTYEMHKDFSTRAGDRLFRSLRDRISYVSISEALMEHMVTRYGIDTSRILVAHDAVDLDAYDQNRNIPPEQLRCALGLPPHQLVLLHTGSLYEGRGIELFKPVLDTFPEVLGVAVGGRDEDVRRWKDRFSGYSNMVFVGHRPQETVVQYQMAADLLLFPMTRQNPIWWCSSPLKLFEYMASGTPILGTSIGGASEVFDESVGIVFDPEQRDQLLDGVRFFLQNPDMARQRAKAGLHRIKENHTWTARARRIVDFIDDAARDGGGT